MTTKSFAIELRNTIRTMRDEQGIIEIKCDNLIAYLEKVINSPEDEVSTAQMEQYKAQLQLWIKQHEASHASRLEMFRSVILAGQNALRTAFLVNGGATVTLLAFLGKLFGDHQDKILLFAPSLLFFVLGVFLAGLSSGFTYLSQWFYGYASTNCCYKRVGLGLNIFCMLLGLASYVLFICGSVKAYKGFVSF